MLAMLMSLDARAGVTTILMPERYAISARVDCQRAPGRHLRRESDGTQALSELPWGSELLKTVAPRVEVLSAASSVTVAHVPLNPDSRSWCSVFLDATGVPVGRVPMADVHWCDQAGCTAVSAGQHQVRLSGLTGSIALRCGDYTRTADVALGEDAVFADVPTSVCDVSQAASALPQGPAPVVVAWENSTWVCSMATGCELATP
jgi:hypothetical protein